MFGLGTSELLIVFGIIVLLFGASRLPELGRGLGQGLKSFKDAMRGGDNDEVTGDGASERSSKGSKDHQ